MNPQASIAVTANATLGTGAVAATVSWLFDCVQAHALLAPSEALRYAWAAAITIAAHWAWKYFTAKYGIKTPGATP